MQPRRYRAQRNSKRIRNFSVGHFFEVPQLERTAETTLALPQCGPEFGELHAIRSALASRRTDDDFCIENNSRLPAPVIDRLPAHDSLQPGPPVGRSSARGRACAGAHERALNDVLGLARITNDASSERDQLCALRREHRRDAFERVMWTGIISRCGAVSGIGHSMVAGSHRLPTSGTSLARGVPWKRAFAWRRSAAPPLVRSSRSLYADQQNRT